MNKLIRAAATTAAVAALATTWTAAATAAPGSQGPYKSYADSKSYCPPGVNVVYVTQNVVGQPDVGLAGLPWAADSYQRLISVVKVGPSSYCAATRTSGWFSSVFGPSPAGTGTVFSGDVGQVYGSDRTTVFTAQWRPLVPTSGTIPTVSCDGSIGCPAAVDWTTLYFENVQGLSLSWWTYTYYGGTHGNWLNRADTSLGDIVDAA